MVVMLDLKVWLDSNKFILTISSCVLVCNALIAGIFKVTGSDKAYSLFSYKITYFLGGVTLL